MELGQVVDFCIEYNSAVRKSEEEAEEEPKGRMATQEDWDAFFN